MYNRNGGGTIQSVDPAVEEKLHEIRTIAEDLHNPHERKLMLFFPSPLFLDSDQLYLCFKPGIKISALMVGSMPMMGMTGPVDPAGVYILALAEALGAAAVLHAIFPDAKIYIYPHPQSMDLRTGHMAFGTVEHARLEMIKMQVMRALGLQYYNVKDIMTSAQMPGSMAQGDKALGFYTGLMAGYKAFNFMTLSTDQVWSPVQALLDVQALTDAWEAIQKLDYSAEIGKTENTISEVLETNCLFAETADTLLNMNSHYQQEVLHQRFQTSESWQNAGTPEELDAVEQRVAELISQWDFHPPSDKLGKIADIYYKLCKYYNTQPLKLK
jgi:trimethylamine:corrinoid methyltransferase-like protein